MFSSCSNSPLFSRRSLFFGLPFLAIRVRFDSPLHPKGIPLLVNNKKKLKKKLMVQKKRPD